MRFLLILLFLLPCRGDFLLWYYEPNGAVTDFSTVVSLYDGDSTVYELTGQGEPVYPDWVDNVAEPTWDNIAYGAPEPIVYMEGTYGPQDNGQIQWTAIQATAIYSQPATDGSEYVWVDPPGNVPEPGTWMMIAGGLLLLWVSKREVMKIDATFPSLGVCRAGIDPNCATVGPQHGSDSPAPRRGKALRDR